MTLSIERLSGGPLADVSLSLGVGCHTVLAPRTEAAWFVEVVSGAQRPRTGKVRVDGCGPRCDPKIRRRMGVLFDQEPRLVGRTIGEALAWPLGGRDAALAALTALGLDGWVERPTAKLSDAEVRSVALAAALAIPNPALILLCDPFARTVAVTRTRLLDRLEALGSTTCVVCATSSVRDALVLGGTVVTLLGGKVVNESLALAFHLAPGNVRDFVIRTPRARELATLLLQENEVVGVTFDARWAPRELKVRGRQGEQASLAILRAARAAGIPINSLIAEDPSLQLAQSASQGALRAAFEQGYHATTPLSGTGDAIPVPSVSHTPAASAIPATGIPAAEAVPVPTGAVSAGAQPTAGASDASLPVRNGPVTATASAIPVHVSNVPSPPAPLDPLAPPSTHAALSGVVSNTVPLSDVVRPPPNSQERSGPPPASEGSRPKPWARKDEEPQ